MALHRQITYYRLKEGLSQRDLAARSGLSPASVCLYEQGKRIPSLTALFRLAGALGVSVSDLTREEVNS